MGMWAVREIAATVAIVDDDEAILDSVQLVLAEVRWTVRTYASGEAFLKDLEAKAPPDCLILDPHLRGIDGAAVARSVSGNHASLPIIALTARPHSPLTLQVLDAGASTLLTKPVTVETLINQIEGAIRAARSP